MTGQRDVETERFRTSALMAGAFVAALWTAFAVQQRFAVDTGLLGVRPGDPIGLIGVFTAPLAHGGFGHLLANSLPVFLLITGLLYLYRASALTTLALVWPAANLATWFFARPDPHIGASGIVYGLCAFLFWAGVLRRERRAIALALIVVFLYGGSIWGIFPGEAGQSWETHLSGAVAGVIAALIDRLRFPGPLEHADDAAADEDDEDYALHESFAENEEYPEDEQTADDPLDDYFDRLEDDADDLEEHAGDDRDARR